MYRFIAILLLAPWAPIKAQESPPPTSAVVTTIVERHEGAVGGLLVDQIGYVYVADFQDTVYRLNPVSGEIEPYATGFYGTSGNTFDKNGNIIQSSFYGHTIHRISRTGEVTTIVDEGLNGPVGVAFNPQGELLVCNCNDQSIKKVDASGVVTEFAKSEHLVCPNGVALDDDGNAYVVSFASPKIVKITPEGETSLFADAGGNGLGHITFVGGVFYTTSFYDNKVYRVTTDGSLTVLAGSGERGQADGIGEDARFSSPNGIHADPSGNYLYINDYLGDANATGMNTTPFSVRRIELPSLTRVLDFALKNGSIADMKKAYTDYVEDPGHAGENWEPGLNQLGWQFMSSGELDEAIAVLQLNIDAHPDSWRGYSLLGAAYMRAEENEKAIEALRKSIELNPENHVAKGRLETLGVEVDT